MKIKVDIKTPDLNNIEIPFTCPNCKKVIKKKVKDLKTLKECPQCRAQITWKN
ncbi:MAG: hypothetical protein UX37_C0022G0009 [Microgenomates group bacterium GW2011_GWA2_46_16]|nr:MAG: hypothetical protein UX37_C0022G0009 [Microgenomates group bacterium GW2011_GWA2_46_16]